MTTPTIENQLRIMWRQAFPPEYFDRMRRLELALTGDGRVFADRLHGTLAAEAMPGDFASDQVADEPGSGYDTIKDRLSTLSGYAPLASPTFTGTLTAADLITTGDATLGNGDADVQMLRGHLRHKSAAPSIAVGVALGTGGSVGAIVTGTDHGMQVTLTAGTTSLTTGAAATITHNVARVGNVAHAWIPINSAARTNAVQAGLSGSSVSTIQINFNVAPTSGTVYIWEIVLVEWVN